MRAMSSPLGRRQRAEDRAADAHTRKGRVRAAMARDLMAAHDAGRIQVTRATYELLEDEFLFEPRGTVQVKGKGDMETWYLTGRPEAPAVLAADDLAAADRVTA